MRYARYIAIILATLSISMNVALGAEVAEIEGVELERIIITNRRVPVSVGNVTENVTIVDGDEIRSLPVRNVSEVLSYTPGVDIEPRRGFGRSTGLTIQGSNSRHVRIMLDGIPFNPQSSGQFLPSELPIENISRIEVVKGAASSIWGSGLGGVINIVTKDTGTTLIPKGSVSFSMAEFNTKKGNLELSGKAGDFGYYVFSSLMDSDAGGVRANVTEEKAFSKVSYDLKEAGRIVAIFGCSHADIQTGRFQNGRWFEQPYWLYYGKIGWEAAFGDTDVRLDLKHSRHRVITKTYNSITDDSPSSTIKNKDVLSQLSIVSATYFREHDLLVMGADFDWDIVESYTYLSKPKNVKLAAPYANYTLSLHPLDLNFGLRYDYNSEFGDQLSPTVGAIYHVQCIPETVIRGTVSRAFTAPPLLWKFNESSALFTEPNPDIKAERAWIYELGLESQPIPEFWFKVSAYRAEVSDALAAAWGTTGILMQNFDKFRRKGIELESRLNLFDGLYLFGGAAFNNVKNRITEQNVKGIGSASRHYDMGVEYKNHYGFSFLLKGYYDDWNQNLSVQVNDKKLLFDLKASQEFKNLTFFLNVFNLTDREYWADINFPVPGRYFEGGISYKW